ncbi:agmatine deiminase [Dellaglioa algida]|uniref:Putative agmatine deiminase n=1 Tax=Dellaglioa algida TaxID=105612 RepID=A0A5C6MCH3_9LACO|nr:agmatine deiminase [Dellaglioa algida]MDK1716138.1 agmatine deiminase [Dellaglioa algida]MDK1719419.1 agmatine deiminase [Dellaglioa algida]MDK1721079.1 agmatine deiminase [Dellaglioa algida]MDK1722762.1 agmatine deiminase [Dellaglioa algida]MDK1724381.1 agmatine deiminase [Dellaglioa algida]
MKIMGSTPRKDHFYLPAETIRHHESIMMWPERPDNWRNGANDARRAFIEIAVIVSRYEPVTMLVSRQQYKHARHLLPESIRVIEMSFDDAWIKDIGPTYVLNDQGDIRGVDWRFNAWGGLVDGLYFPWDMDDQVAEKLCELNRIDYYRLEEFILEGCAFHTDGEGTLIVTEESILSEGRNGQMTKPVVETILKAYLGVEKIIWLKYGYYMDETNGDVDSMLSFVQPGELVLTWTDDVDDPQYVISQQAYDVLKNATDAKGRQFKIHKLQIPKPLFATEDESNGVDLVNGLLPRYPGDRLTASYVNFYLANDVLILPVFDDPQDNIAIEKMSQLFPDRKMEPVYARELLLGGGNVHSIVDALPTYTGV